MTGTHSAAPTYIEALVNVALINPESVTKGFPHEEIEYIDISSVGSGTLEGAVHYRLVDAPSRAKRLVSHGDTIVSTVRPNRRSFLFVKHPLPNLVVSTGFAVLRPTTKIAPRFLYYTVSNQAFTDYLTANAKGAAYPAVDTETFERAEINVPPVDVQRKVAAILSAYDGLIESNTRRIETLEEMAQMIYREWFVNFRFLGHESVRMVESELGLIPEGWQVQPIGEAVQTMGGGTPSTRSPEFWEDGAVTWFVPSDLTRASSMYIFDSEKKITQKGLESSSARLFPPHSVMMTSRATIGVVAINTKEACTNQGFVTCVPNEQISALHIYFWIQENLGQIESMASGATYKEINRTEFRSLPIIIPDTQTAKSFAQLVQPIAKQIENLLAKNANLFHTRDLLLPRLMSGETDVETLDIDTGEVPA